jgi:hypothetical protein
MPDPETLKLVLSGGSFGLLAVLIIWAVKFGVPTILTMIQKQGETFAAEIANARREYREDLREDRSEFREALMNNTEAIEALKDAVSASNRGGN